MPWLLGFGCCTYASKGNWKAILLLDGKQGYVVLSIAFLNKDALWIYLLDDVFAGVWEVQNAVVVLDTLLVRFLD